MSYPLSTAEAVLRLFDLSGHEHNVLISIVYR